MNHFRSQLDTRNASPERDEEGTRLLERFRLICKLSHMSDDIMKEIDMLQRKHNQTGFFSEKDWFKFLEIFQIVTNTRKQSNVLFMDPHQKSTSKNVAGANFINESLFDFKVSILRGVLDTLNQEVHALRTGPMKADTAEDIEEIERTITYFKKLLIYPRDNIDWKMLRVFMDNAEERIQSAKQAGKIYSAQIDAIIKNSTVAEKPKEKALPEPTADEMREMKREYAWGNLLDSSNAPNRRHISNQELERIKANLHPEYSYDKVTNTIIKTVKNSRPATPGMGALDMDNPEYKKAMAKVLKQQGNLATPLAIEVRDDLHKKYGMKAANGELMYNTLAETFSGTSTWNPIDLSVAGFDEFQILTHEKNAPNSPWHTLRVSARRHGSSVREILTIMCKPEEVRAGAQARFAIKTRLPAQAGEKEARYTTTIEFLEVSRIRNMKKKYGNTPEPQSIWDKTKDSVKNTWNKWFSKKAA